MRKVILLLIALLCFFIVACQGAIIEPPDYEEPPDDLESMLSSSSKIRYIMDNEDLYPERLIESLERNPELIDFAFGYPDKKGTYATDIDLSSKFTRGEIPLFMQWDQDWGYAPYGEGVIGLDGCGPTSLSMVYVALTGDTSYNPLVMARFSENKGYFDKRNDITLWTLMSEGAKELGLNSKELPLDENIMARELSNGRLIICSMKPGDFTAVGHFIVFYDYKDGDFYVKDPNSKNRSQMGWSYTRIKSQINNIWAFWK